MADEESEMRLMLRAHGQVIRSIAQLSPSSKRALIAEILESLEGETNGLAPESLPAPEGYAGQRDQSLSDQARSLLSGAKNGMSLGALGAQLYPRDDPANGKRKARSVMRWLAGRGQAENRGGIWFSKAAPAATTRGRRPNKESKRNLVLSAVTEADRPMTAGEILAAVKRSTGRPVKPVSVYAAAHQLARDGKLAMTKRGTRAVYSIPNGGRGK